MNFVKSDFTKSGAKELELEGGNKMPFAKAKSLKASFAGEKRGIRGHLVGIGVQK